MDEELVKAMLFHRAGRKYLKTILEKSIGTSLNIVKPIMREAPIPWDKRIHQDISAEIHTLYRTGLETYYADMIVYGEDRHTKYLFVLEFKKNLSRRTIYKEALNEIIRYTLGLPALLYNPHDKIRIYKEYLQTALEYNNVNLDIERILIQPIIVSITPTRILTLYKRNPKKKTLSIKENLLFSFCVEHNTRRMKYDTIISRDLYKIVKDIVSNKVIVKYMDSHLLNMALREYTRERWEEICRYYNLSSDDKLCILMRKCVRKPPWFIAVRENSLRAKIVGSRAEYVTIPQYLTNELFRRQRNRVPVMYGYAGFDELLEILHENRGSGVYIHLYLNGPSLPVFYFETCKGYLALQHRNAVLMSHDGFFNVPTVMDVYPNSNNTMIDNVVLFAEGTYTTSFLGNSKFLKVHINAINPLLNRKYHIEFIIVNVKVNPDDRLVKPYMYPPPEEVRRQVLNNIRPPYDIIITRPRLEYRCGRQ